MTSQVQRFCPACDRAFLEGEPTLRCPECGLMQHPTCWIANEGCLTEGHENVSPVPEAYERRAPQVREEPPPRVVPGPPPPERRPVERPEPSGQATGSSTAPPRALPMRPPRPAERQNYPPPMVPGPPPRGDRAAPPVGSRRRPNPGELGKPSPGMARIYDRGGILRFWYVPVGILMAVGVAFGVVWGIDRFTGDDDPVPAATDSTPTGTTTPSGTGTPAAGVGTTTPPADATPTTTPGAAGASFAVGQTVTIQGTGNCLNIRSEAGLDAQTVDCLADGTQLELLEGPVVGDALNWWRIQGPNSTGWAADLYFAAQ